MSTKAKARPTSAAEQSSLTVQRTLTICARHHALVSRAISGPLKSDDGHPQKDIDALVAARILLPYEENAFHLNPTLRSFLLENLNQNSAFEHVTRNDHIIKKIKNIWEEVRVLARHGEDEDAMALEAEIYAATTELIYNNERNQELLDSQVLTDYGNVSSLRAKMRQNEFYGKQASELLKEHIQLTLLLELLKEQARGDIMMRVRDVLVARLSARIASWTTRLNDVIATMSRRYFQKQVLEARVNNLSLMALWLTKNPTLNGLDVEVDDKTDPAVYAPAKFAFKPRFDFFDNTPAVENPLRTIMSRLPAKVERVQPSTEPVVRLYKGPTKVIETALTPTELMVADLVKALKQPGAEPISIKGWQPNKRQEQGLDEGAWIMYASAQLASRRIKFSIEKMPRQKSLGNRVFTDIIALPPGWVAPVA